MKCKKCGTEVEKGVKVCPNCGEKIRGKKLVWKIIIGFFVISTVCTIVNNTIEQAEYSKMSPEEKAEYDAKKEEKKQQEKLNHIYETDNSVYVYEITKDHVKKQLKSPSTAKFPKYNEVKIYKKDDTYVIGGYVDAQNSFGAMIRTNYSAVVQQIEKEDLNRDSYVFLSCDIE